MKRKTFIVLTVVLTLLGGSSVAANPPDEGSLVPLDACPFATTCSTSGAAYEVKNTYPSGTGILGIHSSRGGTAPGLYGKTRSQRDNANAVLGLVNQTAPGSYSAGVRGINRGTGSAGIGVWGSQDGSGWGVYGQAPNGRGVYGRSTTSYGVFGQSTDGDGVYGYSTNGYAVYGRTPDANGSAVYGYGTGQGAKGVEGLAGYGSGYNWGVKGHSDSPSGIGVLGANYETTGSGVGVLGYVNSPDGRAVWGDSVSSSGYAGYFDGRVHVTGYLNKAGGGFKIDHPLDPENQYLNHSFVESPDMMNVYNGNVTTDGDGTATVRLPAYFEALNREYRYQLTVIGTFAQAIIAREIEDGQFVIRTDQPHVKVSWQVTGIRQDAYAQAHPMPVEEPKPEREQGTYLHPVEHGQPEERGRDWEPLRADQAGPVLAGPDPAPVQEGRLPSTALDPEVEQLGSEAE